MFYFKIILLFAIFTKVLAVKQVLDPYIRYTNIKWLSSNCSMSSFKCYIKSYSRQNTTLNVFVNFTKPIYEMSVRYDLRNSQRSIINTTVDLCSFLNGTETNPIFKWILGMVPNLVKLLHPCPYEVCCWGTINIFINKLI